MFTFIVSMSIIPLIIPDAPMEPRRFAVTSHGIVEVGTCDARVYRWPTTDNKLDTLSVRPQLGGVRPKIESQLPLGTPAELARYYTCEGSLFRNYAAGRLAIRNLSTGDVRVGFDLPRLTDNYHRLHYCMSDKLLFWVHSHWALEPKHHYYLSVTTAPLDMLHQLPRRGEQDASLLSMQAKTLKADLDFKAFQACINGEGGYGLPTVVTPEALADLQFDISCLADGRFYCYVLMDSKQVQKIGQPIKSADGSTTYQPIESPQTDPTPLEPGTYLVQLQHVRKRGVGTFENGTRAFWDVVGRFKTDITGPFWIVQVSPTYFVAIDSKNRVIQFTHGKSGNLIRELAKSRTRIQIIHDGRTARIESKDVKLLLDSTGVSVPIRTHPSMTSSNRVP